MTMAERLNVLQPATRRSVSSPNDFIRYCTSTEDHQQTSLITISDNDNLSFENSNNNNKRDSGNGISSNENKHKQMAYSSGGHADFIFRYAAKELFDYNLSFIDWKPASAALAIGNGKKKLRSARLAKKYAQQQHYYEAKLYRTADGTYSQEQQHKQQQQGDTSSPSQVVLHFVIAHGMQTLQRALKDLDDARSSSSLPSSSSSSSSIVQYVEAMACPFGCVNGGGIVRSTSSSSSSSSSAVTTRETPTDTRQRVQKTVAQLTVPSPEGAHRQQPQASTNDQQKQQLQQATTTKTTIQQLHTRYHVVPPMQHTMGAAAGVKVQDMVW